MANYSKNTSGICSLAKRAKDRLRKNIYTKGTVISYKQNTSAIEQYVLTNKQKSVDTGQSINFVNNYDEELYKKVCYILDRGRDVVNPILELMDKDIFKNLDWEAKQKYLNSLQSKYKVLKARYYKEHNFGASFQYKIKVFN